MNNISLIGRMTADAELKQTPSGVLVTTFNLAVDRPKVKDTTDFIPCVAWRNTAEFISKYFKKGQKIAVTGALTSRQYKDKENKNRTVYEVVVENAEFCESKAAQPEEPKYNPLQESGFEELKDGDDLPF